MQDTSISLHLYTWLALAHLLSYSQGVILDPLPPVTLTVSILLFLLYPTICAFVITLSFNYRTTNLKMLSPSPITRPSSLLSICRCQFCMPPSKWWWWWWWLSFSWHHILNMVLSLLCWWNCKNILFIFYKGLFIPVEYKILGPQKKMYPASVTGVRKDFSVIGIEPKTNCKMRFPPIQLRWGLILEYMMTMMMSVCKLNLLFLNIIEILLNCPFSCVLIECLYLTNSSNLLFTHISSTVWSTEINHLYFVHWYKFFFSIGSIRSCWFLC